MTTESPIHRCRVRKLRDTRHPGLEWLAALLLTTGCADHARIADALRTAPERNRTGSTVSAPGHSDPRDAVGGDGPTLRYRSSQARRTFHEDSSDVTTLRIEPDLEAATESTLAPVRVSLAVSDDGFAVWSPAELEIEVEPGESPQTWSNRARITVRGDELSLDGQPIGGELRVRSTASDLGIELQGRRYAGELRFLAEGGKVRALNVLPLEDYLRGVVPVEVSPSWSPEALKTIAVAARTYALFQMEHSTNRVWDVTDGIDTQMYGGLSAADARSDQAVRDTEGEILLYDQAPILATYHAASGGYTEDARRVWMRDLPYLRAQPDPAGDASPALWRAAVSFREVEKLLKSAGYKITKISSLDVQQRTPSGRAWTVRVRHARGFIDLAADRLKAMLGGDRIHSTLFQIARTKTAFLFTGRGNGHGVGLSQMGALALAKDGRAYSQILSAYYPGTELARLQ